MVEKLIHICEVCGKTEVLTPEEGLAAGWDYPPHIGMFKSISPRKCGSCPLSATVWWAMAMEHKEYEDLTPEHKQTLERIIKEPVNILVMEENDEGVAGN